MAVYGHELGRCCSFLPYLSDILFTFTGFPFTFYYKMENSMEMQSTENMNIGIKNVWCANNQLRVK